MGNGQAYPGCTNEHHNAVSDEVLGGEVVGRQQGDPQEQCQNCNQDLYRLKEHKSVTVNLNVT